MPCAGENEKCGNILSIHILENCMKPEWPEGSRDKVTNGSFTTYTIFKTHNLDIMHKSLSNPFQSTTKCGIDIDLYFIHLILSLQ